MVSTLRSFLRSRRYSRAYVWPSDCNRSINTVVFLNLLGSRMTPKSPMMLNTMSTGRDDVRIRALCQIAWSRASGSDASTFVMATEVAYKFGEAAPNTQLRMRIGEGQWGEVNSIQPATQAFRTSAADITADSFGVTSFTVPNASPAIIEPVKCALTGHTRLVAAVFT